MQRGFTIATVTVAVGLSMGAAAQEAAFTCAKKKHPDRACTYVWNSILGECKYSCVALPKDPPGLPVVAPGTGTTPTTPGTSHERMPLETRPLSAGEQKQLEAYRELMKGAKSKGTVKANEWAALIDRAELDLYKKQFGNAKHLKELGQRPSVGK